MTAHCVAKIPSDDITFSIDKGGVETMPPFNTTRYNETAVMFYMPKVSRKFRLRCGDASIYVNVGYKPGPFSIRRISVDNWETMTIEWSSKEPSKQGYLTNYTTKTTAYWKVGPELGGAQDDEFHICNKGERDATSCRVSLSSHNASRATYFNVKVNSTNTVGNFTSPAEVAIMSAINKPKEVHNLVVERSGQHWLRLKWMSSAVDLHDMLYEISVSCCHRSQVQTLIRSGAQHVYHNISGLPGGMQCNITVIGRCHHGIIWSNPQHTTGTTRDSVPSSFPAVIKGAFATTPGDQSLTSRTITLYWKPIPRCLSGGNITGYTIFVKSGGQVTEVTEVPPTTRYQHDLTLKMAEAYNVSVVAHTKAGYNPHNELLQHITIAEDKVLESTRPQNVTAIIMQQRGSEIRVSWTLRAGVTYTGYWCVSQKDKVCHGALMWVHNISSPWDIDPSASTDSTLPKDPYSYRFGISADDISQSSGITWSDCVYNVTRKSRSPKVSKIWWNTTSVKFWLTPESENICPDSDGFSYRYIITFWSGTTKRKDEMRNVSVQRDAAMTIWEYSDLKPNTRYFFSIHSLTTVGLSAIPTEFNITTRLPPGPDFDKIFVIVGSVLVVAISFALIYFMRKAASWAKDKFTIPFHLPDQVHIDEARPSTKYNTADDILQQSTKDDSGVSTMTDTSTNQSFELPARNEYNMVIDDDHHHDDDHDYNTTQVFGGMRDSDEFSLDNCNSSLDSRDSLACDNRYPSDNQELQIPAIISFPFHLMNLIGNNHLHEPDIYNTAQILDGEITNEQFTEDSSDSYSDVVKIFDIKLSAPEIISYSTERAADKQNTKENIAIHRKSLMCDSEWSGETELPVISDQMLPCDIGESRDYKAIHIDKSMLHDKMYPLQDQESVCIDVIYQLPNMESSKCVNSCLEDGHEQGRSDNNIYSLVGIKSPRCESEMLGIKRSFVCLISCPEDNQESKKQPNMSFPFELYNQNDNNELSEDENYNSTQILTEATCNKQFSLDDCDNALTTDKGIDFVKLLIDEGRRSFTSFTYQKDTLDTVSQNTEESGQEDNSKQTILMHAKSSKFNGHAPGGTEDSVTYDRESSCESEESAEYKATESLSENDESDEYTAVDYVDIQKSFKKCDGQYIMNAECTEV